MDQGRPFSPMIIISLIICSGLSVSTNGAKILIFPLNHGSHINFFSVLGGTLQKAGHDVHVLVSEKYKNIPVGYDIKTLEPILKTTGIGFLEDQLNKGEAIKMHTVISKASKYMETWIREIFDDTAFIKKIGDMKFDLMIMDGLEFGRYIYLLPYKFNVPFVTVTAKPDPWLLRVPAMPSVEGMLGMYIINDQSTLIDRTVNSILYLVSMLILPPSPISVLNEQVMTELVPEKENIGFRKLFYQSEIILMNTDVICLDYPRISSPYFQYIGGLGAKDAKPLSKELDEYMKKSVNGVIVLSFGSGVKKLEPEILNKFLDAFKEIKQNVIMRHSGKIDVKVPSNVKMTSWLPQNDLLGNPNTKLFITHAGNNGQLEAVYHGVPMLMMPLFGDQMYNVWRAEAKGYGKHLDIDSFTKDKLKDMITELIDNVTYYNNIKKCSNILHSLPAPQNTAMFWIEHVLEFGGSHLRPWYLEMPLWKLFMFDVMFCSAVLLIITCIGLKYCCKKCCFSKKQIHQKQE